MGKFKIYLEYDGTRYSGWQKQHNAKTVQGTLLKTAAAVFGDVPFDIQGSGRTDSGVHALLQVAHLDVKTMLAPEIIKLKFNDLLPSDINILEIEKTHDNFHARHSAASRTYLYKISKRRTAFAKNYVWWVKDKLDVQKMRASAEVFKGMHDFISFADEDDLEKSSKVLIEEIAVDESEELITIRIRGSHFLRKMVRRITGILVEAGRSNIKPDDVAYFLNNHSNVPAKYTAPPSGLFLEYVEYKPGNETAASGSSRGTGNSRGSKPGKRKFYTKRNKK